MIGVLTCSPTGCDVFVVIEVDDSTTSDEVLRRARLAAGPPPEVAEMRVRT